MAYNLINLNHRYVCHFLHLDTYGYDSDLTVSQRYTEAVSLANNLGGKKYHTKTYGGGIVFQSYNLRHLCEMINDLTNKMEA